MNHPLVTLFMATGFVGPLIALLGLIAAISAVRRWLDLRSSRMAPESLQKALELKIRDGQGDAALKEAVASRTFLGEVVAAGLYLRKVGLDEMLANVERTAAKESLRLGNRVANLARWGGAILLIGLFGTTLAIINTVMLARLLAEPKVDSLLVGFGESLMCIAVALLVSLLCFGAFFLLDSRLTQRTLAVREIAEEMMRDAAAKSA